MINMQEQDLDASSGLTYPIRIIISLVIAIIPVIVWFIVWSSLRNIPHLNLTGLQRLESLIYLIVVSGFMFIPTFRGVYSFLTRR